MAVSNNQLANQTTFNNAFVSRTANDNTTGKKDLENADAASGPNVTNVQREINSLDSFSGRAAGSIHNALPGWTNSDVGVSTDTLKDRADALTGEFNPASGHTHSGAGGEGPQIAAASLTGLNYYRAEWQSFAVVAAVGVDDDVSSSFSGFTPGGTTGSAGVLTGAPNNKVYLIKTSDGTNIEDAQGQRVFARLTEAGGVWTLSYFTNEAGVETAYSFTSTDITVYYRQVFTLATLPTIGADVGAIGSLDYTADIVDASSTQRGAVSIGTQSFSGAKTFLTSLIADALLVLNQENNAQAGANLTLTTPTKPGVRLTGAATSIDGIIAPSVAQTIVLMNTTGVDLTINNETGTAANRILTGTGSDLDFKEDASIVLSYDLTSSRWRIIGGGGGTIEGVVTDVQPSTWWSMPTLGIRAIAGDASILANGDVYVFGTTQAGNAAMTTPYLLFETGSNLGFVGGATAQTGGFHVVSGNTDGIANTGEMQFSTGTVVDGGSGALNFNSGQASGTGSSGNIQFASGQAQGAGNSGSIVFATGTAGGLRGPITFATGYVEFNVDEYVSITDEKPFRFRVGADYVGFKSPAVITASVDWTLPAADGTSGQSLTTDGSGILSWGAAGGQYTTQNFTGVSITTTADGLQRWRYTGGMAQILATITASVIDGAVLNIMGTSDTNTITLNHNDVSSGWLLNGAWSGYRGSILSLQYDSTLVRWVEVSRNGA